MSATLKEVKQRGLYHIDDRCAISGLREDVKKREHESCIKAVLKWLYFMKP
jgi:hypothetical protein